MSSWGSGPENRLGPVHGSLQVLHDAIHRLIPRSIRGMLLLLLLVVLVPVLVVQASIYYNRFERERNHELQANSEIARAAGAAFQEYLQNVLNQEFATGLALTYPTSMPTEQANVFLARIAEQYPAMRSFSWISSQGRIIASALPEARGLDISDRSFFKELVRGQPWTVSDLLQSRANGELTVIVARAVRDQGGILQGVVVAAIDPRGLGAVLHAERVGQASIGIIDRQLRVVYRYPEVELSWEQRAVGGRQPFIAPALDGKEVTGTFATLPDWRKRVSSYVPIRSIGWVAGAGRPEDELMTPILWDLLRDSGLLLLVALGALAVALFLSRSITSPVRRLQQHALALPDGPLDRQVRLAGPREVEQLADAFNRMATEMLLRRELRQRSEERYRTLAEAAQDAIFVVSRDRVVEYMNAVGARMSGLRPEDIIGKRRDEVFPCALVELGERHLRKVFETGEVVDNEEMMPHTDSEVWIGTRLVPLKNAAGEVGAVLGISRDITEHKRTEETLQEHLRFLQVLIDTVPIPIWYKDAEGVYLGCNAAFEAYIGLSKEQIIGKTMYDLFPKHLADAYFAADLELFQRGGVQVYEPHVRYTDGTEHEVLAHKAIFRNADGSLGGLVGTMLDITERKRARKERERLLAKTEQANQRLNDFLGMVSHDLRQPLTVLTGMADWLHRSLSQKGLDRETNGADTILKSAKRMNAMIQDLVESVRLESGPLELHKEPTDLVQLIADIAQRAGSVADWARIKVEFPQRVPQAAVDPNRIERAIVNLLTNALKYSPPDTPVVVRVDGCEREITVSVTDQGVGIPPEDLPHLFERFYRAKTGQKVEGLGLGLYITRLIVQAHGGRIWVESKTGDGSTFRFTLPAT